jgi:hypothetical protein
MSPLAPVTVAVSLADKLDSLIRVLRSCQKGSNWLTRPVRIAPRGA